jgi:hypothetical protein
MAQVTPSVIIKVSTTSTVFNQNIPQGINIIDVSTGKQYLTLLPIGSTKSISTCTLNTDIKELKPDQTVSLSNGTGISVTGSYPNFTITNSAPSSGGTVTSVSGTSPIVSSGGNTPAISINQSLLSLTKSQISDFGTYSTDIHSNIAALNLVSGTNTGDNATNSLYSSLVSNATHTGDATGSTTLTVVKIQGISVDAATPTIGDYLNYNGTNWVHTGITNASVGLSNVTNNAQWYSANHPTTVSGYGITDIASSIGLSGYLPLTGGVLTNSLTSQSFINFINTGGTFYIGRESSTAGGFFTGSSAYANVLYSTTNNIQAIVGSNRTLDISSTGISVASTAPWVIVDGSVNANFRGLSFKASGDEFASIGFEVTGGELRHSAGVTGWGGFQTFYTNGVERFRIAQSGAATFSSSVSATSFNLSATTASTSSTTGALVVGGGVGVGKEIFINKTTANPSLSDATKSSLTVNNSTIGIATLMGGSSTDAYQWLQVTDNATHAYTYSINPLGGMVGIGYTSDPTSGNKLAVNGNAYVGGSVTARYIKKEGGTSAQYLMADGSTSTGTGGGSSMVYPPAGIAVSTGTGWGTPVTIPTVYSVSGTGTVSGLTLSGTVTTTGSLTLGGTISITKSQVSDFPSWSASTTKPSYAWSEITSKPTALSSFTNDLGNYGSFVTGTPWTSMGYLTGTPWTSYGYITGYTETDPTIYPWAKQGAGYISLVVGDNDSDGNPNYGLGLRTTNGYGSVVTLQGWAGIKLKTTSGYATLDVSGNLYTSGSITANGGGFNSSRSLKNIHPDWLGSATDELSKFKLRDFNYKTRPEVDSTLGFIIDEIPQSVAKYVLMNKGTAINTYTLHGLEVKAIQELTEKNKELEARLEKLEKLNGIKKHHKFLFF